MSRSFFINGESLITARGPAGSLIASTQEVGLAEDQLRVTIQPFYRDLKVEAWGDAPPDVQRMNCIVRVSMRLIHFDRAIVEELIRLSLGGAQNGQISRAGALIGNGLPLYDPGNFYFSLNITSPVGQLPWCLPSCHLEAPIGDWPLGAEKTVVSLTARGVPYAVDPYNAGQGALNYPAYTHTLV